MSSAETAAARASTHVEVCVCGSTFQSGTPEGAVVLLEHHTRTEHGQVTS